MSNLGMRLAIDGLGAKSGGGATVLLEIAAAALRLDAFEEVIVYVSPRRKRTFDLPSDRKLKAIEVERAEYGPLGRIAWHEWGLSRAAELDRAAVVLCLGGGGLARGKTPFVNLVQQSLPFTPEGMRALAWRTRMRMHFIGRSIARSCRRADLVIVQSDVMSGVLEGAINIHRNKIRVVEPAACETMPSHNATSVRPLTAVGRGLRILYVGSDSPHKNLKVLDQGMTLLRATVPAAHLFATIDCGDALSQNPGVTCLGTLTPAETHEAYRHATLLAFPSLAETVGLPLIEAAAAGLPVLAADLPYARSVCQDAAEFFDPNDPRSFAFGAERLLASPKARQELAARGLVLAAKRHAERPYDKLVALLTETARAPQP